MPPLPHYGNRFQDRSHQGDWNQYPEQGKGYYPKGKGYQGQSYQKGQKGQYQKGYKGDKGYQKGKKGGRPFIPRGGKGYGRGYGQQWQQPYYEPYQPQAYQAWAEEENKEVKESKE